MEGAPAQALGHEFSDPSLLLLALTHRSYCAEHPGNESNERLEFLGDAVLGLAVTDEIHGTYTDLPEGKLAKLRASVVNTTSLADLARANCLGVFLRLGKGEEMSGGREKESILADALEAVIGAVFEDAGWNRAREVVLDLMEESISAGAAQPGRGDFKTQLQELAAELELGVPSYPITGTGPDHERSFTAHAVVNGEIWGSGTGTSKKRAEQKAAREALDALNHSTTPPAGEEGEPRV